MPYLQNVTHEGFIFNEASKAEFAGNGVHAAMAMQYFVANLPTGQLDGNNQPIYANYNIGQAVGLYSSNGTGANLTEVYANPLKFAISTRETELSNVTVWTANSIPGNRQLPAQCQFQLFQPDWQADNAFRLWHYGWSDKCQRSDNLPAQCQFHLRQYRRHDSHGH